MTGEPLSDAAREAVERLLDDSKVNGVLTSVRGEFDEDGFHLRLELEDGDIEVDVRVRDTENARDLLREVNRARPWIEEEQRERAAYEAASPEERARVLGTYEEDATDEAMRDWADLERKRAKGE